MTAAKTEIMCVCVCVGGTLILKTGFICCMHVTQAPTLLLNRHQNLLHSLSGKSNVEPKVRQTDGPQTDMQVLQK